MIKILILSRLDASVLGEPKNSQVCMIPVPDSYNSVNSIQTQDIVKTLFKKNPDRLKDYRIYHTKLELDLSNGSEFSCAFFEVVSKLSDEDLKGPFKPIVYYKWGLIYKFCLLNASMVWTNTVLAYVYLGFRHGDHGIGVVSIILSALLAAMEVESARSNWVAYSSGGWNLYDFSALIFNIFSVHPPNTQSHTQTRKPRTLLLSCSAPIRISNPFNVWFRLLAVLFLGVTSVTWLRVFAPTRYMITMLMQVFFDFGPFLAILVAVLMIYAYCWRLVEGLNFNDSTTTTEPDFYKAVLTASNFIFGNTPDPLGDGTTSGQYDTIKFIVYVIGNIVLTYVLLNFLIALISGTSASVTQDKDVYDVKELLPLILDFDLVLKGKHRASKITEAVGYEASYSKSKAKFLVLVEENDTSNEIKELRSGFEDFSRNSESSFSHLDSKLEASLAELENRVQNQISQKAAEIEKKLEASISSISEKQDNTQKLLMEILTKLNQKK